MIWSAVLVQVKRRAASFQRLIHSWSPPRWSSAAPATQPRAPASPPSSFNRTERTFDPAISRPGGRDPFGGAVAEERAFGGMRIPTRMTVGWFYGTKRAAKGEFFRLNITRAQFL